WVSATFSRSLTAIASGRFEFASNRFSSASSALTLAAGAGSQTRRQGDRETRRPEDEEKLCLLSPCLPVSLSPCLSEGRNCTASATTWPLAPSVDTITNH